eukprot:CAMPEP_0115207252 /NCGR_PEP_ID=MMETSP0270-20121206/20622_1 /TAXON_ID=71861 /ORGANISM="Scrippsiella trochoidea, Strain CCMP3099" /LENGTH=381 /DNA_ID=CAMNT_0002620843 /DNA_START=60 /DNA_END=1205 /DNA_ORIENTATION=-
MSALRLPESSVRLASGSPRSRCSSLVLSELSPLATQRTQNDPTLDDVPGPSSNLNTNRESAYSDEATTARSTSKVTFDFSDFFAPLEKQLTTRLESIERMVEQRCGALEQQVAAMASGGSHGAGMVTGCAAAQSDLRPQIEEMKAKLDAVVADLAQINQSCIDKQTVLQNNIGEVWRQLKADRMDSQSKYQSISDTLESRIHSLIGKGPALSLAIEEEGEDANLVEGAVAEGVVRARSTPSMGPGLLPQAAPLLTRASSPQPAELGASAAVQKPKSSRDRSPGAVAASTRSHASATSPLQTAPRSPLPPQPRSVRGNANFTTPRSCAAPSAGVGRVAAVAPSNIGSGNSSSRQPSPSVSRSAGNTGVERRGSAPLGSVLRR